MRLSVTEISREADRVISIGLADPAGAPLPAWAPGAHLDLTVAPGLVRQYSLCGNPDDISRYKVAVLHSAASRGGSDTLHRSLRVGDEIEVSSPRNHFPMVAAKRYLFIAGGIGITPILPMIASATERGISWELYYLGRSRSSMAFLETLSHYGSNVKLIPKDSLPSPDWTAIIRAEAGSEIYCCGPQRMIDELSALCMETGIEDKLHIERFSADDRKLAELPEPQPFEAVIASTGQIISVAADRSLLQCLLDVGADVLFSCEEGTCGSCETKVLEGIPEHRDSLLVGTERDATDRLYPCVSRSRTRRIVLDL